MVGSGGVISVYQTMVPAAVCRVAIRPVRVLRAPIRCFLCPEQATVYKFWWIPLSAAST